MLCHIQKCVGAEAFIVLQDEHWTLLQKNYTFIALIYIHSSSFTKGMILNDP